MVKMGMEVLVFEEERVSGESMEPRDYLVLLPGIKVRSW